jgi:hypothetical protein
LRAGAGLAVRAGLHRDRFLDADDFSADHVGSRDRHCEPGVDEHPDPSSDRGGDHHSRADNHGGGRLADGARSDALSSDHVGADCDAAS